MLSGRCNVTTNIRRYAIIDIYNAHRVNLRTCFNNFTFSLYQFVLRNVTIKIHAIGALLVIYLGLKTGTADFSPGKDRS